jgi:hypothetical protein
MVQELPVLVDGGEAAEDEDLPATVEEEFDLSDILAEQTEGHIASKEELLQQVMTAQFFLSGLPKHHLSKLR